MIRETLSLLAVNRETDLLSVQGDGTRMLQQQWACPFTIQRVAVTVVYIIYLGRRRREKKPCWRTRLRKFIHFYRSLRDVSRVKKDVFGWIFEAVRQWPTRSCSWGNICIFLQIDHRVWGGVETSSQVVWCDLEASSYVKTDRYVTHLIL